MDTTLCLCLGGGAGDSVTKEDTGFLGLILILGLAVGSWVLSTAGSGLLSVGLLSTGGLLSCTLRLGSLWEKITFN